MHPAARKPCRAGPYHCPNGQRHEGGSGTLPGLGNGRLHLEALRSRSVIDSDQEDRIIHERRRCPQKRRVTTVPRTTGVPLENNVRPARMRILWPVGFPLSHRGWLSDADTAEVWQGCVGSARPWI